MINTILHVLLIFSLVITEMATDIYTPNLPLLKEYFHTTEEIVQWTLSCNLLGIAISSCFYGPLSDSYGRRNIMLTGMLIFLVSSFMCAFACDIWTLIGVRFLQGLGAGVAWVLALAMVTDRHETPEASKIISLLGITISVSPAVAPMLGGVIGEFLGWKVNFVVIGCATLALMFFLVRYLPETLPVSQRQKFALPKVKQAVWILLKNKVFLGNTLISGCMFATLWAFIATAPFVLDSLGVAQIYFGFYTLITVVFYGAGAFLNQFCIMRVDQRLLILVGIIISLVGGLSLWYVTIQGSTSALLLISVVGIYTFSMPFIFSNSTSLALDAVNSSIGTASSIMSGIEMIMSACAITLLAGPVNMNFYDVSLGFIGASVLSMLIFTYLQLRPQPHLQ